eukprot:567864-Pyramimonas_sp.AAC.1
MVAMVPVGTSPPRILVSPASHAIPCDARNMVLPNAARHIVLSRSLSTVSSLCVASSLLNSMYSTFYTALAKLWMML